MVTELLFKKSKWQLDKEMSDQYKGKNCGYIDLFEIYNKMESSFNLTLDHWEKYAQNVCMAVNQ